MSNVQASILFVCTANVCRSPMAAALFAHQQTKLGQGSRWRIESAGTWALNGSRVPNKVQQVMAERGLDLRGHRARTLSRRLLQEFALILVMTSAHREALLLEFPEVRGRVYLLSAMAGYTHDIPDPGDGSCEDMRAVAYEIALLLNCGLEDIKRCVAAHQQHSLQHLAVPEAVYHENTRKEHHR